MMKITLGHVAGDMSELAQTLIARLLIKGNYYVSENTIFCLF